MTRLWLAAGGGGDAIAASILHRALGELEPAAIATYAWDRLAVDPVPGPRAVVDFDGLEELDGVNYAVTPTTRPRPPAGSTLPRLAADLTDALVLLDPSEGAAGMRRQLASLITTTSADGVTVVDVGGDAIARGDEPGLRSPLADGLSLAACIGLAVPTTVLVAGPGLDGELSEGDVLHALHRPPALVLGPDDITPYRAVLDWHPSEATALLAAAALGRRGRVEVRDAGLTVDLTDHSPAAYMVPLADALAVNQLATALSDTDSLDAAEQTTRQVCGFSEIDYERKKAANLRPDRPATITADVDAAIRRIETDAAHRGVDYLTFRRMAEAASLAPGAAAGLRHHLAATRPEHLAWPLWSVTATSVPAG